MPELIYPKYIPLEDEHILPAEEQPLPPLVSPNAESLGERLGRCTALAALPSPPLPPPLHMPPPVDRRDDIPETEMRPRKRLCLSTLGSKYKVGESSTARPTRGQGIDYGFFSTLDAEARRQGIREVGYGIRDTWVDPTETVPEIAPMIVGEVNTRVTELPELHEHDTQDLYALLEDAQDSRTRISQRVVVDSQRVDLLIKDKIAHQDTIQIVDNEAYVAREASAHLIGLSQAVHSELQTHQEQVRQVQMAETLRVMGDMRREIGDMQAELLALREQPRRPGQPGRDARRVDLLIEDMIAHQETIQIMEDEAYAAREAWAHSIGLSQAVHFELQTHQKQASGTDGGDSSSDGRHETRDGRHAGRVGADKELSDGGSPRVIVYGYDGLPMMPVAPPSQDYITGPKEPQTQPAPHDEDEHELMFIQPHDLNFVPESIYPEYIPLEDEHILLAEEQPLPHVVSPTAESLGYVAKSDPEEDPEEYEEDEAEDGPVDYPTDGGDDRDDEGDDDSLGYDADIEDEDDEDEEEEEDDHLAPADSAVVISIDELVAPSKETEPTIPPPSTDTTTIRARITIRPQTSISFPPEAERLSRCMAPATLPSPPLPPSSYQPPPVDRRDGIPESEQLPRKRLCLATLGFRYEVGESSMRGRGVTLEKVNTRVIELAELYEHDTQDLYALLEDAQDGGTHISQRVAMDSQRVNLPIGDTMTLQEIVWIVEEEADAVREAWA
nr:hypothetical protein [Tanacetum cinerariifolium]